MTSDSKSVLRASAFHLVSGSNEALILADLGPEQVASRLLLEGMFRISTETSHQHVSANSQIGGDC